MPKPNKMVLPAISLVQLELLEFLNRQKKPGHYQIYDARTLNALLSRDLVTISRSGLLKINAKGKSILDALK